VTPRTSRRPGETGNTWKWGISSTSSIAVVATTWRWQRLQERDRDRRGANMGWHREVTFGEYELRLAFSRSGSFHRRAGRDPDGHGIARLGGRHLRVALRHRTWNDLTEAERWDRIHGYHH
jgi:hypothetical protein